VSDDDSGQSLAGWILLGLLLAIFVALALWLVGVGGDEPQGDAAGAAGPTTGATAGVAELEGRVVGGVLVLSGTVSGDAGSLTDDLTTAWGGSVQNDLDDSTDGTLAGATLVLRGTTADRDRLEAVAEAARARGLKVRLSLAGLSGGGSATGDQPDEGGDGGAVAAGEAELTVDRDTVALRGVVPDEDTRDRIVAIAEALWGATNVEDQLTVDPKATDGLGIRITGAVAAGDLRAEDAAQLLADELGAEVEVDGIEYSTSEDDLRALQTSLRAQLAAEPIQFETGSAQLTAESSAILDRAVRALQAAPGVPVTIEGHTDDQGGDAANLTLSQARAETVLAYLVDGGVDEDRLTALGRGETDPIADNTTADGRAENRRIEFVFVEDS
jgi:OOP family OmpA-OmpF porin